ncbi:MAG: CvpA family protein [Lachnospiraceae bacterium]|nr:CvpA family protein [Lachnospiraceae bacterium]
MITFVFTAIMLLILIWRIKRGYANGMMQEIVNLLSGVVSLACVALIFLAVRSAVDKSMHALTACIVALVLLGVVFKLCHLIFAPLLAVGSISIVSGINKLLGALMGAAEGCLLAYILYRAFIYLGIYVL